MIAAHQQIVRLNVDSRRPASTDAKLMMCYLADTHMDSKQLRTRRPWVEQMQVQVNIKMDYLANTARSRCVLALLSVGEIEPAVAVARHVMTPGIVS